jgi:hypothetical protein
LPLSDWQMWYYYFEIWVKIKNWNDLKIMFYY